MTAGRTQQQLLFYTSLFGCTSHKNHHSGSTIRAAALLRALLGPLFLYDDTFGIELRSRFHSDSTRDVRPKQRPEAITVREYCHHLFVPSCQTNRCEQSVYNNRFADRNFKVIRESNSYCTLP